MSDTQSRFGAFTGRRGWLDWTRYPGETKDSSQSGGRGRRAVSTTRRCYRLRWSFRGRLWVLLPAVCCPATYLSSSPAWVWRIVRRGWSMSFLRAVLETNPVARPMSFYEQEFDDQICFLSPMPENAAQYTTRDEKWGGA